MGHTTRPDRAIIYVPADVTNPTEFAAIAAPCLERIEACGYELLGIVRYWSIVVETLASGRADVAIVLHRGQLPRDRTPRVEAVDDPITTVTTHASCVVKPGAGMLRHRRPRRVR